MIVNGVTLPDIPADVLVNNPCATITHIVSGTTESYALNAIKNPWNYIGAEVWNPIGGSMLPLEDGGGILLGDAELVYLYTCHEGDSAWTEGNPSNDPMSPVGPFDGSVYTLIWSSHDITEITALNTETGAFTYGDVWFAKSEEEKPTPTRYSISKAILDDIVHAIQFARKNDKKLKPEEIAGVIRRMMVLPSAYAESTLSGLRFTTTAVGGLPTVYQGKATSTITGLSFETSAVGELT